MSNIPPDNVPSDAYSAELNRRLNRLGRTVQTVVTTQEVINRAGRAVDTHHANRLNDHDAELQRQRDLLEAQRQANGVLGERITEVDDRVGIVATALGDRVTVLERLLNRSPGSAVIMFIVGFVIACISIHLASGWVVGTLSHSIHALNPLAKVKPAGRMWLVYLIGGFFGGVGLMGLGSSFHRTPRREQHQNQRAVAAPAPAVVAPSPPAPPAAAAAPATTPTAAAPAATPARAGRGRRVLAAVR